jgi:hypothetical protein
MSDIETPNIITIPLNARSANINNFLNTIDIIYFINIMNNE